MHTGTTGAYVDRVAPGFFGGRDVAGRMLSEAYDRGRDSGVWFRRDTSVGSDRPATEVAPAGRSVGNGPGEASSAARP
jgi:hypothetical protein